MKRTSVLFGKIWERFSPKQPKMTKKSEKISGTQTLHKLLFLFSLGLRFSTSQKRRKIAESDFQAEGSGFEPRLPLQISSRKSGALQSRISNFVFYTPSRGHFGVTFFFEQLNHVCDLLQVRILPVKIPFRNLQRRVREQRSQIIPGRSVAHI